MTAATPQPAACDRDCSACPAAATCDTHEDKQARYAAHRRAVTAANMLERV